MSRKATKGSFKKGDKRAGRPKGVQNKATVEVRELCQGLTTGDPEYIAGLGVRLKTGSLAPAMETMLWYFAHGKPKEQIEVSNLNGGPVEVSVKLLSGLSESELAAIEKIAGLASEA